MSNVFILVVELEIGNAVDPKRTKLPSVMPKSGKMLGVFICDTFDSY